MDSPDKVRIKLKGFFQTFESVRFTKKEIIIPYQEKEPAFVYFLEKGFVSQSIVDENRKNMIVNIFRPYSYFPMINALSEMQNHYEFSALTDITVRKAPANETVVFTRANPDVLYDLSKRFGLGIDHLLEIIKNLRFERAQTRIYNLMSVLGTRFGKKMDGHVVIDFPLTHKDIASYTGLSRETVTREFSKLEKEAMVYKQGNNFYIKIHPS